MKIGISYVVVTQCPAMHQQHGQRHVNKANTQRLVDPCKQGTELAST